MSKTKQYVVGFAFSPGFHRVVLIRKARPAWQQNLLNGVGGKIERTDLTVIHAMVREFEEETGLSTTPDRWIRVGTMLGNSEAASVVHVFITVLPDDVIDAAKTVTDEQVEIWTVRHLLISPGFCVPNLSWLLPLCINAKLAEPFSMRFAA